MRSSVRSFKQRLAEDETIPLFALSRQPHPVMVEMFGLAGDYGGFWIDCEHARVSTEQITALALAGRANQMDNFVRLAPTGYDAVTQCYEAGAGGVMAAQIHGADHAEEFVKWCKFAPRGTRGLNTSGYDAGYSHMALADFVEHANQNSFVAIQIETLGALRDADAIAAIDGVDLLFIGPADLSHALGVVGQFHHEKLWTAIEEVAAACQRHGKHWGCVAPDPKFAERARDNRCRMPTVGNDSVALRVGIASLQGAFTSVFPQ